VNTASVGTNGWKCWPAVLSRQIENMRIGVSSFHSCGEELLTRTQLNWNSTYRSEDEDGR
jgi:hypothetical protein